MRQGKVGWQRASEPLVGGCGFRCNHSDKKLCYPILSRALMCMLEQIRLSAAGRLAGKLERLEVDRVFVWRVEVDRSLVV